MRLFGREEGREHQGEINLKCRTSNTMILCACHYTLMWYERENVEKVRAEIKHLKPNAQGNFALCDVCKRIDLMWLTEFQRLMEERAAREEKGQAEGGAQSLFIEPVPDLAILVAKALSVVIPDYNKDPTKYESICEGKLEIARREAKRR